MKKNLQGHISVSSTQCDRTERHRQCRPVCMHWPAVICHVHAKRMQLLQACCSAPAHARSAYKSATATAMLQIWTACREAFYRQSR